MRSQDLFIVRRLCFGALGVMLLAGQGIAQQKPGVLTGKEKLAGKATDEQRVDNCKVPPTKRGPKVRPAKCQEKEAKSTPLTQ